jgi:TPP-dependent pyruvate/acetoin dehydrogenase alpha subunit
VTDDAIESRSHYHWMLAGRLLEDELCSWYRQGRISGGVYRGKGQEALAAACGLALRDDDIYAPLIRDCAGKLARGLPMAEVARSYLGKRTGAMRGRDGNVHHGDLDRGVLPMISHLGAMIPVVVGMLLSRRLRGIGSAGTRPIGLAMIGDGGMATGALHEAFNAAAVHRLPLVLVVANNQYSYSTPNSQSFACADLADRAAGYGVAVHRCDAEDPAAVRATISAATGAARDQGLPQMVVARLLRMCGHGEHDDHAYIEPEIWSGAVDCVAKAREQLLAEGVSEDECDAIQATVLADIAATREQVFSEPDASPDQETWCAYASLAATTQIGGSATGATGAAGAAGATGATNRDQQPTGTP